MEKQNPKIEAPEIEPEQLTDNYSEEIATFFEMEKIKGIQTIVFDSMDDLKKAFSEYQKERYSALGKQDTPPEPPRYLKGLNPGGPRWKEVLSTED